MAKVTHLLHFLLNLNPQKKPEWLAFYNYFRYFALAKEDLTAKQVNTFFSVAMNFEHWQKNRKNLSQEVFNLLKTFCHQYETSLRLEEIQFPQELQVITIENSKDLIEIMKKYYQRHHGDSEQSHFVWNGDDQLVGMTLFKDQSLIIQTFNRLVTIHRGDLVPLQKHFSIHYNKNLELDPNQQHCLSVDSNTQCQFRCENRGIVGHFIRGYTFQNSQEIKGEPLSSNPRIFYPLKRLEQFFIHRKTDQLYNELVSGIEKAICYLKNDDPHGPRTAQMVYEKSKIAYDNIYREDRVLGLLLKDLANTVTQSP